MSNVSKYSMFNHKIIAKMLSRERVKDEVDGCGEGAERSGLGGRGVGCGSFLPIPLFPIHMSPCSKQGSRALRYINN